MNHSLDGLVLAVIAADGVNDSLLNLTKNKLEAKGATVITLAPRSGFLLNSKNKTLWVDQSLRKAKASDFDALYIPGGVKSISILLKNRHALNFICEVYSSGKNIAIDEEGISLLSASCYGKKISQEDYSNLEEEGVFIHTQALPSSKRFIRSISGNAIAQQVEKLKYAHAS